jgi:tripartite-type tricarboxylate transporter receptor subunit TctC
MSKRMRASSPGNGRNQMTRLAHVVLSTALGLTTFCAGAGQAAAAFPDHPLRLVVSFPAGSSSDQIARQVGAEMSKDLGQAIVVENRPGAQTIIGMQNALAAAPDGYTIVLFGSTPAAINVSMYKKLSYDPVRDFTPIGLIGEAPLVMVVSPSLPVKTASQLVRYAKENPGKLNCGYGSTATQVSCEGFASLAGIKMVSVAYKGTPQALVDLISGSIDLTFFDYPFAVPQIQSGQVKSLGVTSKTRFALAPDMPTIADAVANFDLKVFFGLAAPGQLPPDVLHRLSTSLDRALTSEDLTKKLSEHGLVVRRTTPAQFTTVLKEEIANWARLIKAAGIPQQE